MRGVSLGQRNNIVCGESGEGDGDGRDNDAARHVSGEQEMTYHDYLGRYGRSLRGRRA